MDLTKLDMAIAEAREFLSLAHAARHKMEGYEAELRFNSKHPGQFESPKYPIDECAKVRAKSMVLYRALVDLRRKEESKNV